MTEFEKALELEAESNPSGDEFYQGAIWAYNFCQTHDVEPIENDRHKLDEANINLNYQLEKLKYQAAQLVDALDWIADWHAKMGNDPEQTDTFAIALTALKAYRGDK